MKRIFDIQKEVKIEQGDRTIILEKGDRIKVLREEIAVSKDWSLFFSRKEPLTLIHDNARTGMYLYIELEDPRNGYNMTFNESDEGDLYKFTLRTFEEVKNFVRERKLPALDDTLLLEALNVLLSAIKDKNYKIELFHNISADFKRFR